MLSTFLQASCLLAFNHNSGVISCQMWSQERQRRAKNRHHLLLAKLVKPLQKADQGYLGKPEEGVGEVEKGGDDRGEKWKKNFYT